MNDIRPPRPEMREEFRKKLRAELVNEAVALAEERRLRRRSFAEHFRWWLAGPRFRTIAVTASLIAVLLAGTGVAAAGSLPGDPGFGLKRAAEQVELALAPTDDAKVKVLATQAERRLDELAQTITRRDKAPTASAEYEAAVTRFAAAVEALRAAEPGQKHEAVEQVVEAARDKHVPVLEELRGRLPEEAQQGIDRAIEEHDRLAPAGGPGERPKSPGPRGSAEPARTPQPRETPRPRVTETPRGGRPASPTPTR